MDVVLRRARPEDANACGVIVFEAFRSISSQHNFPCEIPSAEVAAGLVARRLSHPGFYSVIAEKDGNIAFSTNVDRSSPSARSPSIRHRKTRPSAAV